MKSPGHILLGLNLSNLLNPSSICVSLCSNPLSRHISYAGGGGDRTRASLICFYNVCEATPPYLYAVEIIFSMYDSNAFCIYAPPDLVFRHGIVARFLEYLWKLQDRKTAPKLLADFLFTEELIYNS